MFVNNDGKGIVAGRQGKIALTFDYGTNWKLLYSGNDELRVNWLSIYSEETKAAIVMNTNWYTTENVAASRPLQNSEY